MNTLQAVSILGLSKWYNEADLKKAYRRKAAVAHPDTGGSAEQFNLVNTAYEYLKEKGSQVFKMQITHKSLFKVGKVD